MPGGYKSIGPSDGKKFDSENQPANRGRPKGVPNTATRLSRFLNATMRGKHPVTGEDQEFTVAEIMDLQQVAKAMKGDTAAWEKILDRMEGKAKNVNENLNLNVDVTDEQPETITSDKIAELERILGDGKRDTEAGTVPGKRKAQG